MERWRIRSAIRISRHLCSDGRYVVGFFEFRPLVLLAVAELLVPVWTSTHVPQNSRPSGETSYNLQPLKQGTTVRTLMRLAGVTPTPLSARSLISIVGSKAYVEVGASTRAMSELDRLFLDKLPGLVVVRVLLSLISPGTFLFCHVAQNIVAESRGKPNSVSNSVSNSFAARVDRRRTGAARKLSRACE